MKQAEKEGKIEELRGRQADESKAKATNPNNPITERMGAGVNAATEKIQEKWHEGKKQYHESQAENEPMRPDVTNPLGEDPASSASRYEKLREDLYKSSKDMPESSKKPETEKFQVSTDTSSAGFYAGGWGETPGTTNSTSQQKTFNTGAGSGAHEKLRNDAKGQFHTPTSAEHESADRSWIDRNEPSNPISDRMGGSGPSTPEYNYSANHTGTAVKESELEKEHSQKAQEQRDKAKDSNCTFTERVGAAASSIGETAKEKLHNVKKQYHEYQADREKQKE